MTFSSILCVICPSFQPSAQTLFIQTITPCFPFRWHMFPCPPSLSIFLFPPPWPLSHLLASMSTPTQICRSQVLEIGFTYEKWHSTFVFLNLGSITQWRFPFVYVLSRTFSSHGTCTLFIKVLLASPLLTIWYRLGSVEVTTESKGILAEMFMTSFPKCLLKPWPEVSFVMCVNWVKLPGILQTKAVAVPPHYSQLSRPCS